MVDTRLGEHGEQEALVRLERALLGTGVRFSGSSDLGLDLILQFSAPLPEPQPLHFGVQVKAGDSYGKSDDGRWRVRNVSEERFRQWQKSKLPVLFVWVRPQVPAECLWALIKKDTSLDRFSISKHATIAPSLRYDLTLESARDEPLHNEVPVESLRPPLGIGLRPFAKEYYRGILRSSNLTHPVLGPIGFTGCGWRHLTKQGRSRRYIQHSLQLLSCVPTVLPLAGRFVGLRRLTRIRRGEVTTEVRLLAFQGPTASFPTRPPAQLILVFRERIVYPTRWFEDIEIHKHVRREVTFESVYEKVQRRR
jgi:hypothetical protein